MGLPKADVLIQGLQKNNPRLHDLLKLLSNEVGRTQKVLGNLVFGASTTIAGRQEASFADVEKAVVNQVKIADSPKVSTVVGSSMSKRISVRL